MLYNNILNSILDYKLSLGHCEQGETQLCLNPQHLKQNISCTSTTTGSPTISVALAPHGTAVMLKWECLRSVLENCGIKKNKLRSCGCNSSPSLSTAINSHQSELLMGMWVAGDGGLLYFF